MSGHSKWSTIKRKKGVLDAKRGQVFTKLANAITIATREGGGGDPSSNFKLRLAIDQAKTANMPKDNIERAIDRGLGKGAGGQLESVAYEGYGPAKIAFIAQITTDNRNRASSQLKGVVERAGGHFASLGAVSWMFEDVGFIVVGKGGKSADEIFEIVADAGAQDIEDTGDSVEIYTKPNELDKVRSALSEAGLNIQSAELYKKPAQTVQIEDAQTAKKVLEFIEKLEDLDDVQKVYSNFDIPDSLLVGIQGSSL